MAHAFNTSTWKVEAGGSQSVWGQSGLYSEFQNRQGYVETLYLNKQTELVKEWYSQIVNHQVTLCWQKTFFVCLVSFLSGEKNIYLTLARLYRHPFG